MPWSTRRSRRECSAHVLTWRRPDNPEADPGLIGLGDARSRVVEADVVAREQVDDKRLDLSSSKLAARAEGDASAKGHERRLWPAKVALCLKLHRARTHPALVKVQQRRVERHPVPQAELERRRGRQLEVVDHDPPNGQGGGGEAQRLGDGGIEGGEGPLVRQGGGHVRLSRELPFDLPSDARTRLFAASEPVGCPEGRWNGVGRGRPDHRGLDPAVAARLPSSLRGGRALEEQGAAAAHQIGDAAVVCSVERVARESIDYPPQRSG
mmetsp:Transcript_26630/g.77450  ORF Transcript_26630/g.77450 Transcript_26630/m.77450 type:complete len:267 (-) Transcript_26630:763-1563(-)